MSSLSSLNRNVMRLSGLNSNMDTETIVANMLKIDQQKIDRQYRSQAKMEWKVTSYQNVNNDLRKLKDEFSTVLKQEQNMLSAYNYRSYKMTYQTASDSAYVTMKAHPHATEGSVSIKVLQLAEAATLTSHYGLTAKNGGNGLKLTMTLAEVSEEVRKGSDRGLSFDFDSNDLLKFTLDGDEYTFSKYATLDTVINTVNAHSENFKIGYSQLTDRFTISTRQMGDGVTINKKVEASSFLFAMLGIDGAEGRKEAHATNGKSAVVEINGHAVVRNSNNFEIDGIDYTLKQVTGDYKMRTDADGNPILDNNGYEIYDYTGSIVNVDIDRDLDHTVNLIKKYVDSYNELLTKLQDLIGEKVDRDYYPLTEEEKSGLSEKELEKWETEAKKGLLRNDSQISNLIMQMRQSFYMKVPGANLMLADIGLGGAASSVDSYENARKGYIEIDETKLRNALRDNPDMVFQMFTYQDTSGTTSNPDEMGLVTRLNTLIDNYVKHNERETQYYANIDITRAKERYIDMVEAMYKKEEQLWKRFTAMETAMSKLNAQNNWLQQQLGTSSSDS